MKNIAFPKVVSCILLLIALIITSPTRVSAGTVTINSTNGAFAAVITLTATTLKKSANGNSNFNYNIDISYDITFTGKVPVGYSFYNIAGIINNKDGQTGFQLPNAGGTGTLLSYTQTHADFGDFLTATPASVGATKVSLTLAGLNMSASNVLVDINTSSIIGKGPGVPVPTTVKTFTAAPSNTGIQIAWETVQETQVQSFSIERSSNGKQWETIETVPAKGSVASGASYAVTDNVQLDGNSYYRLSESDISGVVTYYSTVVVRNMQVNTTPQLFPNPNTGNTIYFTGFEGKDNWQLSITGAGAQNMGTFSVADGQVTLPDLSAGLYFLSLRNVVTGAVNTFRYMKL